MGWGRWLFLEELGQELSIRDLRTNLNRIRFEAARQVVRGRASARRIEALQAECDELKLYVAALISLLITKGLATQEDVASIVDAIDMEDGVADGKNPEALPRRKVSTARANVKPSPKLPARPRGRARRLR